MLDQALITLARLRDMGGWIGDAGIDLHVLVSLLEEAKSRIPRAVADARDQEYPGLRSLISSASPGRACGNATPAEPNRTERQPRTDPNKPRPRQVGPKQVSAVGPIQVDKLTCQRATGSWLVKMVERSPHRSSITSSTSAA